MTTIRTDDATGSHPPSPHPTRPALGPCAACRYWRPNAATNSFGGADYGECRAEAPKLGGTWPITKHDDGCGVFDRIPTPRAD